MATCLVLGPGSDESSSMTAGHGRRAETVLANLAERAATDRNVPNTLLDGYLPTLVTVAGTGRRLTREEEAHFRRLGGEAVQAGIGLPALIDLYMTASVRLWPRLPELLHAADGRGVAGPDLVGMGEAVWRAADRVLSALTAGHVDAQRVEVQREEAFRREFVDDLLSGRSDVGSLLERAEPLGLTLSATHVVVVAGTDRPVDAGMRAVGLEDAARTRGDTGELLVTARAGRLVCLLSSPPELIRAGDADQVAALAGPAAARMTGQKRWRVGIGRPHAGPLGVPRSYREAVEALELAERLAMPPRIARMRDLLVYRVLLRDETAMAELVTTVLGPLADSRGGGRPLLETLEAYFAAGGNAAEAARRLHISVRAMTYRLRRIGELSGYRATDPDHQLSLWVAARGARALGWPEKRLVSD